MLFLEKICHSSRWLIPVQGLVLNSSCKNSRCSWQDLCGPLHNLVCSWALIQAGVDSFNGTPCFLYCCRTHFAGCLKLRGPKLPLPLLTLTNSFHPNSCNNLVSSAINLPRSVGSLATSCLTQRLNVCFGGLMWVLLASGNVEDSHSLATGIWFIKM